MGHALHSAGQLFPQGAGGASLPLGNGGPFPPVLAQVKEFPFFGRQKPLDLLQKLLARNLLARGWIVAGNLFVVKAARVQTAAVTSLPLLSTRLDGELVGAMAPRSLISCSGCSMSNCPAAAQDKETDHDGLANIHGIEQARKLRVREAESYRPANGRLIAAHQLGGCVLVPRRTRPMRSWNEAGADMNQLLESPWD